MEQDALEPGSSQYIYTGISIEQKKKCHQQSIFAN
jgi:hypothetical protein